MDEASRPKFKLGLIGDNIRASQSPRLHKLAGQQSQSDVSYDLLIPKEQGLGFDVVFERCVAQNYRGLNITYPYKERVIGKLHIEDPAVRAIGAVNTVVFSDQGPLGFNTDFTGFVSAYRDTRKDKPVGCVGMIGTGGVGRAVAFGLATLGAQELRLVDQHQDKAEALADDVKKAYPSVVVKVVSTLEGCDGLVNCTPVGMVGYAGTPVPREHMCGATWAFDAVYTPVETEFIQIATAEGLDILSGYELFFWQGVDAWKIFSGLSVDISALRTALKD
jgi:shikimate dehydrogenase